MDPFIEIFDRGLSQLIRQEGRSISVRHLLISEEFAHLPPNRAKTAFYHLNRRQHTGAKPHRPPPWLLETLADVLPLSLDELKEAADKAAGFRQVIEHHSDHPDRDDIIYLVQRFFGEQDPTSEERRQLSAALLAVLAEEVARDNDTDGESTTPESDAPTPTHR